MSSGAGISLEVGAHVEIVASETLTSFFVGMRGTIERLTKPYWLARVELENYPNLVTFWIEELRVLSAAELEEMPVERGRA